MRSLLEGVKQFLVAEDGPTAVEYAVMLALIIVVCIAAVRVIGNKASQTFSYVGAQMNTAGGS